MESLLNVETNNSLYYCEMGYICILLGQYSNGIKYYKDSTKYSNNFTGIEGMILCQLYDGQLDDAEAQIELLSVMNESSNDNSYDGSTDHSGDHSPEFLYLQSLLILKKNRSMKEHLEKLDACQKLYFQRSLNLMKIYTNEPFNEYIVLNPDFLLEVISFFCVCYSILLIIIIILHYFYFV